MREPLAPEHEREDSHGGEERTDTDGSGNDARAGGIPLESEDGESQHRERQLDQVVPDPRHEQAECDDRAAKAP